MNVDEVIGYYTYRSFLNDPVGAPNDIIWGEGELLLFISDVGTVTGTLAFPAEAGVRQKDFMDISGTVTAWDTLSLRFVGKGREESAISDYEYEYDCKVTHEWDWANPSQSLSLLGTVRRNKDHGHEKAGATASFVAVKREFVEPRTIPGVALIPEAVAMLSERTHRLRHTVWHTLRSDWYSLKMTENDRERFKNLGWYLDDPPFRPDGTLDLTNGAGEDFLHMHRRMITMVNELYDKVNKPRPTSWKEIPFATAPQFAYKEAEERTNPQQKIFIYDSTNSGFMVPPPTQQFLKQVKGSAFLRFNKTTGGLTNLMQIIATNLRNQRVLSQLTLGAYGNLIEFTVHNWMHMRWATLSLNPGTGCLEVRNAYDVDSIWDEPQNDYLGDFHSSHVNPVFWKIHGWVDDCIDIWFNAHEKTHPGEVKRSEVGGVPWFEVGKWVNKAEPFDWKEIDHTHHHGGEDDDEINTLEQVMALLKEVNDRQSLTSSENVELEQKLPGFARLIDIQEALPEM